MGIHVTTAVFLQLCGCTDGIKCMRHSEKVKRTSASSSATLDFWKHESDAELYRIYSRWASAVRARLRVASSTSRSSFLMEKALSRNLQCADCITMQSPFDLPAWNRLNSTTAQSLFPLWMSLRGIEKKSHLFKFLPTLKYVWPQIFGHLSCLLLTENLRSQPLIHLLKLPFYQEDLTKCI